MSEARDPPIIWRAMSDTALLKRLSVIPVYVPSLPPGLASLDFPPSQSQRQEGWQCAAGNSKLACNNPLVLLLAIRTLFVYSLP
jgi:hypothetical protein